MQKKSSNTKKKYTQDITRKTEGMFLETWIEKKVVKDNRYNKDKS